MRKSKEMAREVEYKVELEEIRNLDENNRECNEEIHKKHLRWNIQYLFVRHNVWHTHVRVN